MKGIWRGMSFGIRPRLGLLLAAFGVLATGLTGTYSFIESRDLLVHAAERDLLSATQVFGHRLDGEVDEIGEDVRVLAELQLTRDVALEGDAAPEASMTALADAFQAMLRANALYFQVRLISASEHGLELVRVDRNARGALRVRGPQLQEKGHLPYVFRGLALRSGETFVSKIAIDHELGSHAALGQPILHFSGPVLAADGRVLGLVVIGVDVTRMFGDLRANLPPYLQLYMTNEWGDFLIHPDPTQTYGFDQGRRVLIQDTFPDVQPLLEKHADQALALADVGTDPPERVLGAFVRMPFGRSADHDFVVLGLAQRLTDILASTHVLAKHVLQIVAAFSAAAILLAIFASRVVTRPLNKMTQEVKRFSSDHAVGELPVDRRDEIGELARGFDEMQRRIGQAMAELDASRNHMAHMARHDSLTGLPNRAVFLDRLEHAIVAAKRKGGCLAVLFIDLDRFKDVNDTHGHAFGDEALVQTARLLQSAVREVDTVARWGGDEFVILLEDMDEEHEARRVAQALVDRFSQGTVVQRQRIETGASIGISMYPRDGFEAAELIQRADEAMYLAKHRAGNRYSVFGNQLGDESVK